MKKLLISLMLLFIASPSFAVVEWQKDEVAGTRSVSDIDYYVTNNNANLDKLLTNYREGVTITYNDNASIVVTAGEIVCSNAAGTVRRMRKNTASVTSTWTVGDNGLDAGSEASSTTYYVFAEADADADTFKIKISTSSTAPSGVTYYKRIGSFYNDGSSNITRVSNDDDVVVESGTIANGATIALPLGYSQSECKWIVGAGSVSDSYAMYAMNVSASSNRVVTSTASFNNWVSSSYNVTVGVTANYIIVCNR